MCGHRSSLVQLFQSERKVLEDSDCRPLMLNCIFLVWGLDLFHGGSHLSNHAVAVVLEFVHVVKESPPEEVLQRLSKFSDAWSRLCSKDVFHKSERSHNKCLRAVGLLFLSVPPTLLVTSSTSCHVTHVSPGVNRPEQQCHSES